MGQNQGKETKLINENDKKENKKRMPCEHKVGDKTTLKSEPKTKCGEDQHECPHVTLRINDNGTVRFKKKSVVDTFNVRNTHPFEEQADERWTRTEPCLPNL